jgi:hypothetical protein
MEHEGDVELVQRTVHIPFPETFVYSNCAAFALSLMEFRLGFAEAMPDGKAVSRVGVAMPPEAAAVLALVLFKQLKTYEQKFGEIRHPLWRAMKAGTDVDLTDLKLPNT